MSSRRSTGRPTSRGSHPPAPHLSGFDKDLGMQFSPPPMAPQGMKNDKKTIIVGGYRGEDRWRDSRDRDNRRREQNVGWGGGQKRGYGGGYNSPNTRQTPPSSGREYRVPPSEYRSSSRSQNLSIAAELDLAAKENDEIDDPHKPNHIDGLGSSGFSNKKMKDKSMLRNDQSGTPSLADMDEHSHRPYDMGSGGPGNPPSSSRPYDKSVPPSRSYDQSGPPSRSSYDQSAPPSRSYDQSAPPSRQQYDQSAPQSHPPPHYMSQPYYPEPTPPSSHRPPPHHGSSGHYYPQSYMPPPTQHGYSHPHNQSYPPYNYDNNYYNYPPPPPFHSPSPQKRPPPPADVTSSPPKKRHSYDTYTPPPKPLFPEPPFDLDVETPNHNLESQHLPFSPMEREKGAMSPFSHFMGLSPERGGGGDVGGGGPSPFRSSPMGRSGGGPPPSVSSRQRFRDMRSENHPPMHRERSPTIRLQIGNYGMKQTEARKNLSDINSRHRTPPPSFQFGTPITKTPYYPHQPPHQLHHPGNPYPPSSHAKGKENTEPKQNSRRAPCNCKRSRCLKLYCECFAAEIYCDGCNCHDCSNTPHFESIRSEAIKATRAKNPNAFKPRFSSTPTATPHHLGGIPGHRAPPNHPASTGHNMGCRCKKSACLKKYCECFEAGVMCGEKCKCLDCLNFIGSQALIDRRRKIKDHRGAELAMRSADEAWKRGWGRKEVVTPRAVRRKEGKGGRGSDGKVMPAFGSRVPMQTKGVALHVFSFLSNDDLYNTSLVSKMWTSLSLDEELWQF